MLDLMNHRERVIACLAGEEIDRPPASMWRHFYEAETAAETLAMEMIEFQRQFDWDFMKVNPRASYHFSSSYRSNYNVSITTNLRQIFCFKSVVNFRCP